MTLQEALNTQMIIKETVIKLNQIVDEAVNKGLFIELDIVDHRVSFDKTAPLINVSIKVNPQDID